MEVLKKRKSTLCDAMQIISKKENNGVFWNEILVVSSFASIKSGHL